MMRNTAIAAALLVSAALISTNASAEGSIGLKAGTLGIGIEGTYKISEKWGIRGGINQFDYSFDDDIDDITFDGDLELNSIALLADFRPAGGGFRITGGAVINNNEVTAVADPFADYEIGNNIYTLEEVGTLSAVADFDSVSPYLGLGFDWGVGERATISFDLGVLAQGEAGIGIDSTGGTLSNDPALRADLDIEEESGVDDLDDLELLPVLSLGFHYRF
ncbi:MAG: hypothetical protein AAF578_08575 [Pseudomonadota bacterium]